VEAIVENILAVLKKRRGGFEMGGNSFGTLFRVNHVGRSHGKALGVVIDGCPPRLSFLKEYIQREMDKRRPGQSSDQAHGRKETKLKSFPGVFEGRLRARPISIFLWNEDVNSTPLR